MRARSLQTRVGFATDFSESLLATFEHSQAIFEDDLVALLARKTGGLP
jgi:hypothetical protein